MASLIAILDLKGKSLIQRCYRDDVPPSSIENFMPLVLDMEDEGQHVTPCFSSQGVNYMHIRHSNLYVLYRGTLSKGPSTWNLANMVGLDLRAPGWTVERVYGAKK
ncbi:hypothetical protein C8F04DRAFT_1191716 [Mycena alexandri]|uniref:Uncharacterized protein n=1 Tax=Mycena alexandri TaxID=1745969 RepID=A0AAD6SGR1_9AGAR|nr:hypothetical protein C8F04DRAFT_1191716 [Mycena alexandri]